MVPVPVRTILVVPPTLPVIVVKVEVKLPPIENVLPVKITALFVFEVAKLPEQFKLLVSVKVPPFAVYEILLQVIPLVLRVVEAPIAKVVPVVVIVPEVYFKVPVL